VIRQAAVWVISETLRMGGDEDTALKLVDGCDPLIRGFVRQRVRGALQDALLAEREDAGDRVVLQIALLSIAKPKQSWAMTPASVLSDEGAKIQDVKPRWISFTLTLFAGIALVLFAGYWVYLQTLGPQDYDPSRSAPTEGVAAAYATGGKPQSGGGVGDAVFHERLPEYVVALGRWSSVGAGTQAKSELLQSAETALLADDVREAMGEKVHVALAHLVSETQKVVKGESKELLPAVAALNAVLAEAGYSYYVDGDVAVASSGRLTIMLYSFDVDDVRLYRASTGQRERVLHLRRADNLNWDRSLMGFTREGAGEALVLVPKVERQLVRIILPALPEGAELELFHDKGKEPWRQTVGRRAADVVREEFLALVPDVKKAAELGALVSRRKAIVAGWQDELSDKGWRVPMPDAYRLDMSRYTRIEGSVSPAEFDEMGQIDERMGSAEFSSVFGPVYAQTIKTVERHEVQHRLDYARQPRLPFPPGMEKWTGPVMVMGEPSRIAERTAAEASAFLSELARDEKTVLTNLTFIAQFQLARHEWGSPYSYASAMIFQGLAKELGLERADALDDGFDLQGSSEIYLALTRVKKDELRVAAAALWAKYFGAELPKLEMRVER
jgi:hypothetical protein